MIYRILTFVVALSFSCAGCNQTPEIVKHRVPKSKSGLEHLEDAMAAGINEVTGQSRTPVPAASDSESEKRMVVAIAARDDATWFFKINGVPKAVLELEPEWREFLSKIKFNDGGNPVWELPDGWSTAANKPGRFATLKMATDSIAIDMAISSLSAGQDMLLNVNRWRGQLMLQPADSEKLNLGELPYDGGEFLMFDETGRGSGTMRPPFAGGGPPAGEAPAVDSAPINADFGFKAPEGWQAGPQNMMVPVRLLKKVGDKGLQITVTQLSAANDWESNVQRWVEQVDLEPLSAPEVAVRTKNIEVGGIAAKKVRLVEDAEKIATGIVAVMLVKGEIAWFYKLVGDKKLVETHEKDFDEFLNSIQFN